MRATSGNFTSRDSTIPPPLQKKTNMNNSTYPKIPLSALFAKPSKDQLRISPKGTYLAWRGRSSTDSCGVDDDDDKPGGNNPISSEQHAGVLNIFIQKRQPNQNEISFSVDSALEDSRQITFYQERHACAFFIFTPGNCN